ncbi:MAG: hypothetical protein M3066_20850 [Actinomycetota bacterium]|nr:hypothetical protein [Actinomycetota bacterium]
MSDQDDLRAYLNNHVAGGTGAIEMVEHCQAANEGEPLAEFLAELVVEIQKDHRTLGDLMSGLDATENRFKQVMARMGEKASHLKLGGGDLGNLLTLETLSLGIEGKACMWKSLMQVHGARGPFLAVDFEALIKRADDQRRALEPWRLAAATAALNEKAAP